MSVDLRKRSFVKLLDFSPEEIGYLLDLSAERFHPALQLVEGAELVFEADALCGLGLHLLAPDLSHFAGIVPCGIEEFGVTSLDALGIALAPEAWDEALLARGPDFLAALEGKECSLP